MVQMTVALMPMSGAHGAGRRRGDAESRARQVAPDVTLVHVRGALVALSVANGEIGGPVVLVAVFVVQLMESSRQRTSRRCESTIPRSTPAMRPSQSAATASRPASLWC
jgi:hypothetical protein